jgi:hypothetical protein
MTAAPKINETAINRAACQNLNAILAHIADHRGFSSSDMIARLNPGAEQKHLREWKIVNAETGSWRNLHDGSSGPDIVSLVAYLASVDRQSAAGYLATFGERQRREAA